MSDISKELDKKLTVATTPQEVIDRVEKKPFVKFNESLLYEDIGEGKILIDYLIENGYFNAIMYAVNSDLRILDYCVALNRFNFLSKPILDKLFEEQDGSFLAEKYLDNSEFINIIAKHPIADDVVINLYNKGYKKIAINAKEKVLLSPCSGGITILEDMLKSGLSPTFYGYNFTSEKIIQLLQRYDKYDLFYHASLELLMNHPNKRYNYLQYMIDWHRRGINVNFEKRDYVSNDKEMLARCYIQMAKNGLVEYLNALTEDDLIQHSNGEKSLLYYLITKNKTITINQILTFQLGKSRNVFLQLRLLGTKEGLLNMSYSKYNCADMCREKYNEQYDKGCVSPVEELLMELRQLFLNDGQSDNSLIDALIKSYRYCTSVDSLFIDELRVLIKIKKEHPKFKYVIKPNSGYIEEIDESINLEDATIDNINHETAHATHYFLTRYAVPDEFASVLSRIVSNASWIDSIVALSKKINALEDIVYEKACNVIRKYITDNESISDDEEEVSSLLAGEFEIVKKKYAQLGYSDEVLETVLSEVFTFDEFLLHKSEIELAEVFDTIENCEYASYFAICDIIDAITGGKLKSGFLYDKKGKVISISCGHGIRCFSGSSADRNLEIQFSEILAEYVCIIKSKNSNEMIELLRSIVGDELVDMLDDFYRTKILQLPDARNMVVR